MEALECDACVFASACALASSVRAASRFESFQQSRADSVLIDGELVTAKEKATTTANANAIAIATDFGKRKEKLLRNALVTLTKRTPSHSHTLSVSLRSHN